MVDPDLAYMYVVARVDLARQCVAISQYLNTKLFMFFMSNEFFSSHQTLTTNLSSRNNKK